MSNNEDMTLKIKFSLRGAKSLKDRIFRPNVTNKFQTEYKPLAGVDVYHQQITFDHLLLDLSWFDLADQSRFEKIRPVLANRSLGGIILIDSSETDFFTKVKSYYDELFSFNGEIFIQLMDFNPATAIDEQQIRWLTKRHISVNFYRNSDREFYEEATLRLLDKVLFAKKQINIRLKDPPVFAEPKVMENYQINADEEGQE